MSTQIISTKSSDEIVTVFVDYSPVSPTVASAEVTITRSGGEADPNPSAMKMGLPVVEGSVVSQKIQAGVVGCKYKIRFLATLQSGDRYGQTLLLTVTE